MIAEFRVKNFYSIKSEQTLNFMATSDTSMDDEYCFKVKENVRLLKLGIVYGANASGKSNILKALGFFKRIMLFSPENKTKKIEFEPFLLDTDSKNDESQMAMDFYLDAERYILNVTFNKNRVMSESLYFYQTVKPTLIYNRVYKEETDSTEIEFGANSGIPKSSQYAIIGNTINNCTVMAAFGKSNVERSRLNLVYDFFFNHVNDVLEPRIPLLDYAKRHMEQDKDGKLKNFMKFLLKASDFNISGFDLNKDEIPMTGEMIAAIQTAPFPPEVKTEMLKKGTMMKLEFLFHHKTDKGVFDLNEGLESVGTLRFMGMIVLLYDLLHDKRFISIDEFESSLHYELLSYLIKLFLANSEGTSQLLFTTHDINLLDEDFIRQDTIWFTDKDSSGETQLKRLSNLKLRKVISPYNAYRQGKLVKLPFLGSAFINLKDIENECS